MYCLHCKNMKCLFHRMDFFRHADCCYWWLVLHIMLPPPWKHHHLFLYCFCGACSWFLIHLFGIHSKVLRVFLPLDLFSNLCLLSSLTLVVLFMLYQGNVFFLTTAPLLSMQGSVVKYNRHTLWITLFWFFTGDPVLVAYLPFSNGLHASSFIIRFLSMGGC